MLSDKTKLTIIDALTNRRLDYEYDELEVDETYRKRKLEEIDNAFTEVLAN